MILGAVLGIAGAAYTVLGRAPHDVEQGGSVQSGGPAVDAALLTADQARGRLAFNVACADCHGRDALGGDGGPPLIHKVYEPSHHGDGAFFRAVQAGVTQHHWGFGNMPPQSGVTRTEVADIVDYVRAAQRQNGIN